MTTISASLVPPRVTPVRGSASSKPTAARFPIATPSLRASGSHARSARVAAGKFQKISVSSEDGAEDGADDSAAPAAPKLEIKGLANDDGTQKFDDDELPDNLFDAVATAATATEQAISNGSLGNLVELRIDELWDPISGNVMAEAGDQLKVWEITREYAAQLCERMGPDSKVKVVFPDAGCAAMLKARWPEAPFAIASANDRLLYQDGDEVLVFAAPDPPSLEKVTSTTKLANESGAAVVLINPRLASGDAGIGLTVRRMRQDFLGRMTVVYCLQPLPWCNGSIFKRYPGLWRLYLEDETRPGRFKLVQESATRLAGDDLDDVVMSKLRPEGEDGEEIEKGPGETVFKLVRDAQRFMNSLR